MSATTGDATAADTDAEEVAGGELVITALGGIGEVRPGDDLAAIVGDACERAGGLRDNDVVVVTSKVVSKAEGRLVEVDESDPAAKVAVVLAESRRILRRRGDLVISETAHGYVCANAGVDLSNTAAGVAALLPKDPDRSARRLRSALCRRFGLDVLGVVVSDTFGRPWRLGLADVALGVAGFAPIVDHRGTRDAVGRELAVTEVALADELAAAADIVKGKSRDTPAARVRGLRLGGDGSGRDLVRPPQEDLFR